MSNKIDLEFVRRVLAAFDGLRREALQSEDDYLSRLAAIPADPATAALAGARIPPTGGAGQAGSALAQLRRLLRGLAGFLSVLPAMIRQIGLLRRAHRSRGGELILGVATNRLPLVGTTGSPRDRIAALTATLGDFRDDTIGEKIRTAGLVLLCDALPVSRLWPHHRRCWAEHVLIVDAGFLLLYQLWRLISAPARAGRALWSLGNRSRGLREFLYALWTNAYAEVLGTERSVPTEAVFLTSNSTLTEALRGFLLQWRDCRVIHEVMHGIGSLPAERYFARVLAAVERTGEHRKHVFVPQVPNLPLYGVFQAQVFAGRTDRAINAYLNRYFLERPGGVRGLIEAEYRRLRGSGPEPIVVTLFGNVTTVNRLEVASFRAECQMLAIIKEARSRLSSPLLVIYVPHPAYRAGAFRQEALDANGIRLYRDSILCWLISDVCLSLLSSAMFEGVYFGARGFTPMLATDEFYTSAYLDLLSHPRSGSAEHLREALNALLTQCDQEQRPDIVRRAIDRLGRVNPRVVSEGAAR